MKVSTALAGTVAAMTVGASAAASPALEQCKAALTRLNFYPGNTSIPYLSAATGEETNQSRSHLASLTSPSMPRDLPLVHA